MQLTESDIQPQLTRRRPGQSALTTPRDEKDRVHIQSGTEFGITLGTPIGLMVKNEDQRPKDYGGSTMDTFPRPSHADFTYQEKYGVRASSGGGRSSARETIARVAAGAVAEKYLHIAHGVEIVAFVSSVGDEELFPSTPENPSAITNPACLALLDTITRETVDSFIPVRCPDQKASDRMAAKIAAFRDRKDSIGGTVTCVIRNAPIGLGEPCFDKLEASLAQAMLSIPATKGFEIGSGFGGTAIPGSLHNDPFTIISPSTITAATSSSAANSNSNTTTNGTSTSDSASATTNGHSTAPQHHNKPQSHHPQAPRLRTSTNNSGGIQGGISNGSPIYFRVAFKPPATIGQAQQTVTFTGAQGTLEAKGRHDPCVVPRAVPIVEAMAALVIMDAVMAQEARWAARGRLAGLSRPLGGTEILKEEEETI